MYFFALSYMSSWEAMATYVEKQSWPPNSGLPQNRNIGLVFYNGGPRAIVWGFLIVIPGVLCQIASFSEMASMLPIAGVQ
jgi:hypothetical protein